MHTRPPQSRRAGRSNLYSESKFTNWAEYNPYTAEISALPRTLRPSTVTASGCAIYECSLHSAFVRPCTAQEVSETLASIPVEFLTGLEAIYLLGGTSEQEKVRHSRLFRFGAYGGERIYLHAFPRRDMERTLKHLPKPSIKQEYDRAGAVWEERPGGWVCRFTPESLRKFFLYDVLPHEIGHHVDRHSLKRRAKAERFAEWFARRVGNECRQD